MTTEQVRLVKQTYQLLTYVPAETIGHLFYNQLFITAPEVRPLFKRTPLAEQSKKLVTMLTYVVSRLDKLEDIVQEVAALARRHQHYGVAEHHYGYVGQALLWTLEQGLGDAWTPEVIDAWTACYTLLADTMIAATRPAQAA